jgi:hypothetical protein
MRPISVLPSKPNVLFDIRYAYLNDTLILQSDAAIRLADDQSSDYVFNMGVTKQDWKMKRTMPMIDFIAFPNYFSSGAPGGHSTSSPASNAGVAEHQKIMDDYRASVENADADSTVARSPETKEKIDINLGTDKGDRSTAGGAEPAKPKGGKSQGGDPALSKDEDKEPESKDENASQDIVTKIEDLDTSTSSPDLEDKEDKDDEDKKSKKKKKKKDDDKEDEEEN